MGIMHSTIQLLCTEPKLESARQLSTSSCVFRRCEEADLNASVLYALLSQGLLQKDHQLLVANLGGLDALQEHSLICRSAASRLVET